MVGTDSPRNDQAGATDDNACVLIPQISESPFDVDGFIPVTSDSGVLKKVLAEGHGEQPAPFSRCLGKLNTDMIQKSIITRKCDVLQFRK
jgi:hypothetical protein